MQPDDGEWHGARASAAERISSAPLGPESSHPTSYYDDDDWWLDLLYPAAPRGSRPRRIAVNAVGWTVVVAIVLATLAMAQAPSVRHEMTDWLTMGHLRIDAIVHDLVHALPQRSRGDDDGH